MVIDKWMGVKGTTGPVNTVVTNPLGAAITITAGGPSSSHAPRINDLETKLSTIGLLAPAAISHLTIGNITATQNVGTGIELHAVSDAVIEENELGFGHDLLIADSEHVTVSHNIFVTADTAITIDHDSNVTIAGNQIHHVSHDEIHVVGGNDTITIGGNDITDVDGNAIALTGIGGGNSNVSILNNNVQRNTRGISGGIGALVGASRSTPTAS